MSSTKTTTAAVATAEKMAGQVQLPSASISHPASVSDFGSRPRRSSRPKHLNPWLDIDSTGQSTPPPPAIIAAYSKIPRDLQDIIMATFFSALALAMLSVLFLGLHTRIIIGIFGMYAGLLATGWGVWEGWCWLRSRPGGSNPHGTVPKIGMTS